MDADVNRVFEWSNQTTLHPIGLAAVLVLGIVMLSVPRRLAVVPLIVLACFISQRQRIVIMTLDFDLLRECRGEFRMIEGGENSGGVKVKSVALR